MKLPNDSTPISGIIIHSTHYLFSDWPKAMLAGRCMYNKTIVRFGKSYQPQPSASADNSYLDLDYSGYHKNLIQ